jgi:ribonuclease Y
MLPEIDIIIIIPLIVGLCGITFYIGWFVHSRIVKAKLDSAENLAKKILSEAELKSNTLTTEAEKRARNYKIDAEKTAQNLKKEKLLEVKDEFYKRKQRFDEDVKAREKEILEVEKKIRNDKELTEKVKNDLINKEKNVQQAINDYNDKHKEVLEKRAEVEKLAEESKQIVAEQKAKLLRIAALSEDDAKKILFDSLINTVKLESAQKLQDVRDETKLEANKITS